MKATLYSVLLDNESVTTRASTSYEFEKGERVLIMNGQSVFSGVSIGVVDGSLLTKDMPEESLARIAIAAKILPEHPDVIHDLKFGTIREYKVKLTEISRVSYWSKSDSRLRFALDFDAAFEALRVEYNDSFFKRVEQ